MAEEWKDIEGFPGYRISNTGRVWSNKLMRCLNIPESNDKDGYLRIGLWINNERWTHSVHRLVACEFIPNPEMKPTVNHKDKNKHNNHFSNLEWHTVAEQNAHRNLTYKGTKGIHTKPIVLEKDGVEYPFNTTMEARKLLGVDNVYWHKLLAGGSIKGYKIKNIAGV
jgi:hypothetical protein